MLFHAQSCALWELRELWSIPFVWRRSAGQCIEYICETPIVNSTNRPLGKLEHFNHLFLHNRHDILSLYMLLIKHIFILGLSKAITNILRSFGMLGTRSHELSSDNGTTSFPIHLVINISRPYCIRWEPKLFHRYKIYLKL